MKPKQLIFHDAVRDKIRRGVDALAEAVKVTLGPRGRTVILERDFGPPQIVNSGVLVTKSIELEDRFENMGAQLLREVAARTSEMAGDGTATAMVLAHGMIQEGLRYLAGGMNPMDLKRGIEQAIDTVVAELQRMAKPCDTSQEIAHVAAISVNNDRSIGDLLQMGGHRPGQSDTAGAAKCRLHRQPDSHYRLHDCHRAQAVCRGGRAESGGRIAHVLNHVKQRNIMEKTWILIANAERARCFERHAADHSLTELIDFVHPQASLEGRAGGSDLTGAAGKGHGRTGHAGTQFEPHTEAHAKERASFARELADYLNEGVAAQKCHALVLVATSPMLGEIRPCLSSAADKAVTRCIASDLTRYQGSELKQRIDDALRRPD